MNQLLSVVELSRKLKYPQQWLRDQADRGLIPSIKIGRRLLFNPEAVQRILLERAAELPLRDDEEGGSCP